MKVSVMQIGGF